MIWFRNTDTNKIEGYVPQLNKVYNEFEIREMSEYNGVLGWSVLSEMVMGIQGIPESHIYTFEDRGFTPAKSLANLDLDFNFEFLRGINRNDKYLYQIYDVLSHLELLKVSEYTEDELDEYMNRFKSFFSYNMHHQVDYECHLIKQKSTKNTEYFNELIDVLNKEGLEINNIFGSSLNYDGIYKERRGQQEIKLDIHL